MTLTLGCGQSYSTSKFIVDVQKETRLMYISLRIRAYRMLFVRKADISRLSHDEGNMRERDC